MQTSYWRKAKTLHQGYTDDLKKETTTLRIWVSRVELNELGLPLVTEERLIDGRWVITETA